MHAVVGANPDQLVSITLQIRILRDHHANILRSLLWIRNPSAPVLAFMVTIVMPLAFASRTRRHVS